MDFARERTPPGSADEVTHWDLLKPALEVCRIKHSEASSRGGVHANLAESLFSRLRRMISGQHHRIGVHLDGDETCARIAMDEGSQL